MKIDNQMVSLSNHPVGLTNFYCLVDCILDRHICYVIIYILVDVNTTMDKISILTKQQQKLFHASDLRVLWGISKSSTLYQTIYRLVKKDILIRVQKGFYSIVPFNQLDPVEVGFRAINHFSYLSTESVLAKNGVINQSPVKLTFVSSSPANFKINEVLYLVRQLKPQCLNNSLGITQNDRGVFMAITERAVADMLYFQPSYHFDANNLIDWNLVKNYQQQLGYL